MLINAQDPRQWTYLRNLPQKKKKNLVLTLEYIGMEEHTCLHSEPIGKGRKIKIKKTLVVTLGSPPEKGGKKKEKKENP